MTHMIDHGYVIICPPPGSVMYRNYKQVMYFKIGTHSEWDGSKSRYTTHNPDYWYRSFTVSWTNADENNIAPQAGDPFGTDGPKQILKRMMDHGGEHGRQHHYESVYGGENEWYGTTNFNCMMDLEKLQNVWDTVFHTANEQPISGHLAVCDGETSDFVAGNLDLINVGTIQSDGTADKSSVGPRFSHRFGAVYWFRLMIGISSVAL